VTPSETAPETVPEMTYVPGTVAMKSRPATSAPFTDTAMLAGVNEKPVFDALTEYQPFASDPKS
jgi:hypothetical protein